MSTRKFISIVVFSIVTFTAIACGNSMTVAKKLSEHTAQTMMQENVSENPVEIMQNVPDELMVEIINKETEIRGGKH